MSKEIAFHDYSDIYDMRYHMGDWKIINIETLPSGNFRVWHYVED